MSPHRTPLRTVRSGREVPPFGRLRAVVPALLVAAVVLGGLTACRRGGRTTPEPDATGEPGRVAITGACADVAAIDPVAPAAGDAWEPITTTVPAPCFRLSAAGSDVGVPPDASLTFESAVELDPATVSSLLDVEPPVALQVTAADGRAAPGTPRELHQDLAHRYTVVPAEPLPEGEVVRFALRDAPGGRVLGRWAFEVAAPLRVVHTLPGDREGAVPTDTGIELVFSHEGVTGIEELLSISPPVTGTVEVHRRTVVFVPDRPLQPGTLYTVALAPGAAVPGSDLVVDAPVAFSFETMAAEGPMPTRPIMTRHVWEQPTGEAPAVSFVGLDEGAGSVAGANAAVTVFRYPDSAAFIAALDAFAAVPDWAYYARASHVADTTGLPEAIGFEAPLERLGEYGEYVLRFPAPLEAGYYLLRTAIGGAETYGWLQVTDLGAYAAVSESRTLVWVNDVVSGEPVAGARVTGGVDATTGADGTALVDTPPDAVSDVRMPWGAVVQRVPRSLVIADSGGRETVVPLSDLLRGQRGGGFREWRFGGVAGPYWRYMYTDRNLYRPTDTVHVWGVARARDGAPAVTEVTVEVVGTDLRGTDYRPVVLDSATVAVSQAGTYSGTLQISGASPGWYQLRSRVGDRDLSATGVEVRDFVKPLYQLEVTPDRRAARAGESVTMTVRATFLEGSPVPNVTLRAQGDVSRTLTTDASGMASFTYELPAPQGGLYNQSSLLVTPAMAEEGLIEGSATVVVVPASLTFAAEAEAVEDRGVISGTVYAVDLARVNDDPTAPMDDFRGDAVEGAPVSATVVRIVNTAVETGEVYDFVEKRVRKQYRYEAERQDIGTFPAATGPDGRFSIEFPVEDGSAYEVALSVTDDAGQVARQDLYLFAGRQPTPDVRLSIVADTEGPYDVGDEVALRLERGEAAPEGGQFMFIRARNGIQDVTIVDEPALRFEFAEEHVPNVVVLAVRFTGTTYEETEWGYTAQIDPVARRLQVVLEPDRERYTPGMTATLGVRVTDAEDRPVAATVLLAAIDAAIVLLQGPTGQEDAFLRGLYEPASSGIVSTYASHQYPAARLGAEGGGGDGARADFRDMVLFREVTTDADGRATVEVPLPDNLTSWSVTALAVDERLHAGSATGSLPVGLPLFADVTMNDEYVSADRPVVRLRAFGDALAAGDPVTFKVALAAEGGPDAPAGTATDLAVGGPPVEVAGTAFEGVDVPLPELTPGRYEVRVAVAGRDQEDELVRRLRIVSSRLSRVEASHEVVEAGSAYEPEPADGPVTIVLADANRGRYRADLAVTAGTSSDRLDLALARSIAGRLLTEHFGLPAFGDGWNANAYRVVPGGGLSLLPYGGADLDATARAVAAAPDVVGRQATAAYLTGQLDDPEAARDRIVTALWGLASAGEPVLAEVQSLANGSGLTADERLRLGLAAAELGDAELAGRLYRELLGEFGRRRGETARLEVSDEQAEVLEATALAAVLGAMIADDLSPALYAYVASNEDPDAAVGLERAAFLAEALPRLSSAPARVAYTHLGAQVDRVIDADEPAALFLTPDDLAGLDLSVSEGRLGVSASRDVPLDPATLAADPGVTVTRSYAVRGPDGQLRPAGDAGGAALSDGDLVRVNLAWDLPDTAAEGCYQLSDLLPSGMRPGSAVYDPQQPFDPAITYPYAIVGQRVSFCVGKEQETREIAYYARVLGKGRYRAEPTVLQSMRVPESAAIGEAGEVEIR